MTVVEIRTAIAVAFIFFCRMMGLFMVLPVITLYGMELDGATFFLLGIAIGVYGLSQAFLQIPFAWLSDIYGRKPIILSGLAIFFLGSLGASFSEDIFSLIFFRFLQGAGAIAATSMAYLADNSSESSRARVMAVVGIAIGMSFILALFIGPLLASVAGLQGLFQFSALLASLAFLTALFFLKEPEFESRRASVTNLTQQLGRLMSLASLRLYSFSVFALHLVLTSAFLVIPVVLEDSHAIDRGRHAWVFLSVFFVSLLLMGPFARPSSQAGRLQLIYRFCVIVMGLVLLALSQYFDWKYAFFPLVCLFFALFNLMEALLPSMLSLEVSAADRASAMGLFSSAQFLGAFAGGLLSGLVLDVFDITYVFLLCALVFALLAAVFVKMQLSGRLRSQAYEADIS